MADDASPTDCELAAGDFSAWLSGMRGALRGERGSDVPCGQCTACCTSSQFVHIGPDETDTLSHIPAALLFPAPRLPAGHVLLGYDERGHCPMLVDNQCSIYAHRPHACRTYDCRVFPAAGVAVDKPSIARQARRWRFGFPSQSDRDQHGDVQAAATFLDDNSGRLPDTVAPRNRTELAVLATEISEIFAEHGPDPEKVRVEVMRRLDAAEAT